MAPSEHSFRRSSFRIEVILALTTLFAVTVGARPLSAVSNGVAAGIFSGLVLFGVVAWAIWRYAQPVLDDADSGLGGALLALLIIGAIKLALLPFFPGFGPDISSYQAWAYRIASIGPALTYHHGYFIDYPPGYLYALWAAGAIVKAVGAGGTYARVIVEIPALAGDFILAAMVFIYLRRHGHKYGAYAGMLFVAANPAMLFDSVVWGQSDSVMTFLILVSALMALDEEYELAWAVAAVAVLVKPQALSYLPVLGLWTLLKTNWRRWWRYLLAFVAIAFTGIAPFQIGHQWDWIFLLYKHTAAYYHETSVNAFNFMALVGGLRQPDSTALLGVPLFDIGMALLAPLYLFIGWTLYKRQTERGLIYAIFITILGFFLFAPRMHERYIYPALAFVAILAVSEPEMLLIFVVLTLTCLFNIAYVKHALETTVFLKSRDIFAMATAAINLAAFAWAVRNWDVPAVAEEAEVMKVAASDREFGMVFRNFRATGEAVFTVPATPRKAALAWNRIDTILIGLLLAGAAATRFWHLGHPHEIVFDEVHFVAQARHYLRSEPFLDPHPPLAKLIIAMGIALFGDHPWSWRFGNAVIGTGLVGVTYLIGRRMFRSRLAAAIAGFCIACDGMFLVDSRVAVIDIVYIAFAAIAYLFLFRFIDLAGNPRRRRLALLCIGVALGLCLGAKLYIPAMTFILVIGFLIFVLLRERAPSPAPAQPFNRLRFRRTAGAVLLVGTVSAIFYLSCFLPKYILGWWGGIANLFHYYGQVIWYENSVASATHPYSSRWWSWPFMLRPIAYWQHFPKTGNVATIWGGGNPVLWWGALTAVVITAMRSIERPTLVRSFLVLGYLGYLAIWIPIGRTTFLYHYMPAVFLGYLALGSVLADCWNGQAEFWEQIALLLTLVPAFVLGLGTALGAFCFIALAALWIGLLTLPRWPGRLVCISFVAAGAVAFIYFFPIWTAMPISHAGYYARMWLKGPGRLRNWI